MQLVTFFCLLAAMAMTIIPAVKASAYEKCRHKDSQIPYAIHKLCSHPRLMVPGARTSYGSKYGNIRVLIDGNCSPADHVHSQHCLDKFFHLCASDIGGAAHGGGGTGRWDDGCKSWQIMRLAGPPAKGHKGHQITSKGG